MSGGFDRRPARPDVSTRTAAVQGTPASPGKRTLVETYAPGAAPSKGPAALHPAFDPAQRLVDGVDSGPPSKRVDPGYRDVAEAAAQGIAGRGARLPHGDTIQRAFGRHDVSGVEAHVGGSAETASRAIGAEAYATGNHVAFAGGPDLHTAAHEAAHVVQQRGGVQLKGGVGQAGDAYEQHADQVADAVVAGRSAEGLLDRYSGGGGATAGVQRQVVQRDTGSRPAPQQAQETSRVDRLIQLLTSTPAVTGPESFDDAYAFLAALSMPHLLATMSGAADCGYLPQLIARSGSAAVYGRARILSALYAVELARVAPSSLSNERLHQAGVELDQIPQAQQLQVLEYLLHRRGTGVSVAALLEGVVAMRAEQTAKANTSSGGPGGGAPAHSAAATAGAEPAVAAGTTGAPAPVEPGPWEPPGEQPIPFYIGNEAHKGIARTYEAAHPGDDVRSNALPISSLFQILNRLGHTPNAGALNETEIGLMPDITNLARLHLYEIKPVAALALGAAKATLCVGLFGRAGIAMQLGPMTEPGTSGGLPAPGGVYMFWSPEPGVIVYQYRKGRLVPVPVPEPEPARVRRWRFELQPMTQQQQQAVTTLTFGGALLLIAMILLSPAGI